MTQIGPQSELNDFFKLVKLAILFTIGAALMVCLMRSDFMKEMREEGNKTQQLRNTDSGKFALDHMQECLSSGTWFSSAPTRADCINSTANAASSLRGDTFAEEVRTVLADQFAPAPIQPKQ